MKYTIVDNHNVRIYDAHRNLITFDSEEEASKFLESLDVPKEKFKVVEVNDN